MSTYSTISGTIRLDRAAAEAFKEMTSWQWCDPGDPADGVSVHDDGVSVSVVFDGALYRNLTRYLHVDLARAQSRGTVRGTITDDCTDGVNARTVSAFGGRTVLTGSSQCLHEPVWATPGRILELIAPNSVSEGFSVLLGAPDARQLGHGGELGGAESFEIHGAETSEVCGCGGWDEDADMAVCERVERTTARDSSD
jgi:hypothetical protein